MTSETLYSKLGGEDWVQRFTSRFYQLMDTRADAAACRNIHPQSLAGSQQKLFDYLTGWLGGPPLFVEKHGPPMLRARHLHAKIGEAEISGWLACFHQAWQETVTDAAISEIVVPRVEALAQHMRNIQA